MALTEGGEVKVVPGGKVGSAAKVARRVEELAVDTAVVVSEAQAMVGTAVVMQAETAVGGCMEGILEAAEEVAETEEVALKEGKKVASVEPRIPAPQLD